MDALGHFKKTRRRYEEELDKIWASFLFQTHFAGDLYTSSKKLSTTLLLSMNGQFNTNKRTASKSPFQKDFTSFSNMITMFENNSKYLI